MIIRKTELIAPSYHEIERRYIVLQKLESESQTLRKAAFATAKGSDVFQKLKEADLSLKVLAKNWLHADYEYQILARSEEKLRIRRNFGLLGLMITLLLLNLLTGEAHSEHFFYFISSILIITSYVSKLISLEQASDNRVDAFNRRRYFSMEIEKLTDLDFNDFETNSSIIGKSNNSAIDKQFMETEAKCLWVTLVIRWSCIYLGSDDFHNKVSETEWAAYGPYSHDWGWDTSHMRKKVLFF